MMPHKMGAGTILMQRNSTNKLAFIITIKAHYHYSGANNHFHHVGNMVRERSERVSNPYRLGDVV